MEAEEILLQAREKTGWPAGWVVFPLLRSQVIIGIAGWIFGIIMGAGLLAIIIPVVIPFNYGRGALSIIFTTLFLAVLTFVAVGSLFQLLLDIRRLRQVDKHLIVITSDEFVKQEGDKIVCVPLTSIRHVTPRGKAPVDSIQTSEEVGVRQVPAASENTLGFLLGRGFFPAGSRWRRKRMRTPTSLAFIDGRTNNEVTVVNDSTFGDPFKIAAVLKQYVQSAQQVI